MDENRNPSKMQEELDKLYLEYRPKLIQIVLNSFNDRNLAEDVVQEVFYEACRKKDIFDKHPNKMGWLYRVTGYKVKEVVRKLQPSDEFSIDVDDIEIGNEDEGFAKSEMEIMLYETLTQEELLRFRRYFIWGESIEEIARKEKVNENNMRVKISRLKKKIEKIVQKK